MRLITSPPSCAECHEILEPKHPGTLWATPGLLRDCFTFFLFLMVSKRMRCTWHVTRMGYRRDVYRDLMRRPDGIILLGRPGRRWKNGMKMALQKYRLWRHGLDCYGSGWRQVAGWSSNEPSGSIKCREFNGWEPVIY